MFRLDLFLPFLRTTKRGISPKGPGPVARVSRAVLPGAWLDDRSSRPRAGLIRRILRGLGGSWEKSPVRRVVQAVCFVAFLVLFFYVSWPYSDNPDYAETRESKEVVDAEIFLALDPLVSISTAIAAKAWVWSLTFAGIILLVGVLFPRGFCGYICPLGTLIDLFDWAVGRRVTRFRAVGDGWWVHIKYYLLFGTIVAAMFGVLLSGFVAAIPVLTRGFMFLFKPAQTALLRGTHLVPELNWGHALSITLFFAVLAMGLWRPRFWCRYVCPTGAVFSLGNLFRAAERKVESTCVACNKCIEVCPFDAIKADFTTRTADCTLCQTCGGVCPTHAIKFVDRWDCRDLKAENDPPTHEVPLSRRGFLAGTAVSVATVAGATTLFAFDPKRPLPIRPPGSVPEPQFLELCIRCAACFQACPNDVLQPAGFEDGFEGMWAPKMNANWAGCEPTCNNCGQVCPTGAIRALPMEEKQVARMGLAVVNERTCLPFAGREACQLCVDECDAAGYHAIEFVQVRTTLDDEGRPDPDSGFLAPVVREDLCVGCGLCQMRCHRVNALQKGLLEETAILVEAGAGKEDRMMCGSYLELRRREAAEREERLRRLNEERGAGGDEYLPETLRRKGKGGR
jgi:ferredoxin